MQIKHKALFGAVGLLSLSGIGIGTAVAATNSTPTTPPAATDSTGGVDVPGANETTTLDTDTVQDGPQTAADAETVDTTEKAGTAETPEANGDNHQDAPGANVDYTPPGEQPEATSTTP